MWIWSKNQKKICAHVFPQPNRLWLETNFTDGMASLRIYYPKVWAKEKTTIPNLRWKRAWNRWEPSHKIFLPQQPFLPRSRRQSMLTIILHHHIILVVPLPLYLARNNVAGLINSTGSDPDDRSHKSIAILLKISSEWILHQERILTSLVR